MTVIEKLNDINNVIKELFEFVQIDSSTKDDFHEYLSTMSAVNATPNQMEKLFIPYVFERNLGEPAQSVIEIFNNNKKLKNPKIARSLLNAQYSVFRVKKILKNGFELFNLINEKQYTVLSLTKMTSFRGVGIGEFIVARIFKHENEYYLLGIDNMLPSSKVKEAVRYAIVKIVQSPWLVYEDNKKKENEIKSDISKMYDRFVELFGSDEVITTNRYADTVIGILNDEDKLEDFDMITASKPLEQYKFFAIKELNNSYDNFLENSLGGFSSHTELYDVGVIFDKELGLYSIPFYKTFCMIFEDSSKVEDVKGCVNYFLTNDAISDNIIKRIASKYPNFTDKINEILEKNYTLDDLISVYKSEFLKRKIYSSTSVLYHSTVFSTSLDILEANEKESVKSVSTPAVKVGRNEPCPCGSGKKYKNCCLSLQKNL
ncbi:MAG: SEC-C domain-containing protein [Candidatus Gastranaerophilales bacterium]|nr:SEC-C domain-containing protein [Candidatus Gastranaerophilales bacterium]